MNRDAAHGRIRAAVQENAERLLALSHAFHADPEFRFQERRVSARLVDLLRGDGLEVEHPAGGLDTAFVARKMGAASPDSSRVGIVCEYDALEGLGHACGHNVIATMGAGAGLALASVMGTSPANCV